VDEPHNPAVPAAVRSRPELSRDRILDAALAIIDRDGDASLTYRRLGEELDADPTAAYRYFHSKDDLLLALGDRLLGEAVDAVPVGLGWREGLDDLAHALRSSLLRHPRLAVLVSIRTTQGEQEARGIERVLATLTDAGLPMGEAVAAWRALADTVLAWSAFSAAYLSLSSSARQRDIAAWSTTYQRLPAERYPNIAAARPFLEVEHDAFPLALELLLDGVAARISAATAAAASAVTTTATTATTTATTATTSTTAITATTATTIVATEENA
jgi:AcrR family transcriptional regulator